VKTLLPWLVAVAFFMESLDTTILNTAVPTIAAALHVAPLSIEGGADELHVEPGRLHPREWVDGGPLRDTPCLRHSDRHLQPRLVPVRRGEQHSHVGSSSHPAGCGGSMMVPVGRLTLVRTFERHELVRVLSFVSIPALVVRWWVRSRGDSSSAICTGVSFSS